MTVQELINDIASKANVYAIAQGELHALALSLESDLAQANATIAQRDLTIDGLDATVNALRGYEAEVLRLRRSWWPTLRAELALPKYADWVTAKNAQAIFNDLTAKTITRQLDPIPVALVRAAIASVLTKLTLTPPEDATLAAKWKELLALQTQIIASAASVSASDILPLIQAAKASGIVPSDFTLGVVLVSRADQLALGDEIESPIDITQAMGW